MYGMIDCLINLLVNLLCVIRVGVCVCCYAPAQYLPRAIIYSIYTPAPHIITICRMRH